MTKTLRQFYKERNNFRKWLKQFEKDETPLGDLARDALDDIYWTCNCTESLRHRLQATGASDDVMAVFIKAALAFDKNDDLSWMGPQYTNNESKLSDKENQ